MFVIQVICTLSSFVVVCSPKASYNRYDEATIAELKLKGQEPVTLEQAAAVAHSIGAASHMECSAKTKENIREIFDEAIKVAIASKSPTSNCCLPKCVIL